MRDMNFVTVSVSGFYFVSVPYFLSYGRQRDFYMLLNCVRAQKSIIQLHRLGELQYNNGYWWDRTDQGTWYLWKAERIRNISIVKNLKKSFFFIYF